MVSPSFFRFPELGLVTLWDHLEGRGWPACACVWGGCLGLLLSRARLQGGAPLPRPCVPPPRAFILPAPSGLWRWGEVTRVPGL